jgi:membrane-bound lytic murein transglycosylase B
MFFILFFLFLIAGPLMGQAEDSGMDFQSLQNRLIEDSDAGFTAEQIRRIYNNSGVTFDIKGVASYFQHKEGKLNYDQFLASDNIEKAAHYMRTHHAELLKAEIDYGVDREVITAIMLVETRLGTYVGNRPVLSILSTMAALEDPSIRDWFWNQIPTENRISRAEYEKKSAQKAAWAFKELKAFIRYVEKEGMNPYDINGSYAGALGIAQFMPSNILILGEDGNQDGSVNLFHHPDAIASIANYLKNYGWKPGISREEAEKVVYHYNHSSYYVKTVLNISEKLKSQG